MWNRIGLMTVVLFLSAPSLAQTIVYVDESIATSGAGTGGWQFAKKTLQEALLLDPFPHPAEIQIAQGAYDPGQNINESFALTSEHKGLVIRGGYRGGATNPGDRDIVAFPTILDGNADQDINLHILTAIDIDNDAHELILIDGITIQGGLAHGVTAPNDTSGGGAYIFNSSVDFLRCTFRGNSAGDTGGGLYLKFEAISDPIPNDPPQPHATVRAVNCRFEDNAADNGGGIANIGGNLHLANCLVHDNSSAFEDSTGAGLYNFPEGGTRIGGAWLYNCTFFNNVADIASSVRNSQNLTMYNCILWDGEDSYLNTASGSNITIEVRYCTVGNPDVVTGMGNNNCDPGLDANGVPSPGNDVAVDNGEDDLLPPD